MKVCPHCGYIDDPNPQGFSTKELPTDPDRILARAAHRRNVAFAVVLVVFLVGWLALILALR